MFDRKDIVDLAMKPRQPTSMRILVQDQPQFSILSSTTLSFTSPNAFGETPSLKSGGRFAGRCHS